MMKVLIVENEKPAAGQLIDLLKAEDEMVEILHVTRSVEESVNWLSENPLPDLVFMDIRLDDGVCFEIYENIRLDVPTIFTTAYNDYALRAFKVNSIDYLLKPISREELSAALKKFRRLNYGQGTLKKEIKQALEDLQPKYRNRFLVKIGPRYKSVATSNISAFLIRSKETYLCTLEGREYGIDFSLDKLGEMLDSEQFFRINRTCIVNVASISEMNSYSSSRLQLKITRCDEEEPFVVSREKVAAFKEWMDR